MDRIDEISLNSVSVGQLGPDGKYVHTFTGNVPSDSFSTAMVNGSANDALPKMTDEEVLAAAKKIEEADKKAAAQKAGDSGHSV